MRRSAHNLEVEGSNPSHDTSFRRSGPFPSGRGAFCVSGTVVKRIAATALRAARQRDGGDGGDTGRDSRGVVDAAARDLWVPGPEVARVPTGLFLLVTESLSRYGADVAHPAIAAVCPG